MILDTSAVVAVIGEEEGNARLIAAIEGAEEIGIGGPTMTETSIVLVSRYGVAGRSMLSRFCEEKRVVSVPFDERHSSLAAEAFIRFGKGRHPARLNYGDCMTYATAKVAGHPLLFVGDDFTKTDIVSA